MGTSTHVYIPSTGWAETEGFPKASWPAKLMKMVGSGFHEKASLKAENNNVDRDWIIHPISASGLHMHPHMHLHTHEQFTHVWATLAVFFLSLSCVSEHLGFCNPFVLFSDITGTNHLETFNLEGGRERERERSTELWEKSPPLSLFRHILLYFQEFKRAPDRPHWAPSWRMCGVLHSFKNWPNCSPRLWKTW